MMKADQGENNAHIVRSMYRQYQRNAPILIVKKISLNPTRANHLKKTHKESLEQYIKTVKDMGGLAKLEKAIADYEKVAQTYQRFGRLGQRKSRSSHSGRD